MTRPLLFALLAAALALALLSPCSAHPVHDTHAGTDNEHSATGHGHPRVQIKVYRGPSKGHGYDSFAPWGYWVKQPDDHHDHH